MDMAVDAEERRGDRMLCAGDDAYNREVSLTSTFTYGVRRGGCEEEMEGVTDDE